MTVPDFAAHDVDQELCRCLRAGDRSVLETVMRRNNRRLYRVARAILKDESEAEEAVQEAYVQAFTHLDTFAGRAGQATWLTRIVVNEALGRLRKNGRMRPFSDFPEMMMDEDAERAGSPLWSWPADPEQLAAAGEMRRLIERAVDHLPTAYRTVFVLRAIEQLSVTETAETLGIPPDTVKTRFHRARGALQRLLRTAADEAVPSAFPFAGERCDRIVRTVLARLPGPPVGPH